MDRRVTPLTKGPPPLYKQSLKHQRRGRQRKRLTKMNTPCFKFLPSYSVSFNCQMLANFSGVEFEQTVPKLKKINIKIKSFCRVHVLLKTWNKAVSRGGRAATAKKCTKKRAPSAELLQSKAEAKRGTFHETNQTWWVKFMESATEVWVS